MNRTKELSKESLFLLLEEEAVQKGQVMMSYCHICMPFSGIMAHDETSRIIFYYDPDENLAEITPNITLEAGEIERVLQIDGCDPDQLEYGDFHLQMNLMDGNTIHVFSWIHDDESWNKLTAKYELIRPQNADLLDSATMCRK